MFEFLQQGDAAIISSSDDDPVLAEIKSFHGSLNNLLLSEVGEGRTIGQNLHYVIVQHTLQEIRMDDLNSMSSVEKIYLKKED